MKRKIKTFWDKQKGAIILVSLGIVIFTMTVVSTMGIAKDDTTNDELVGLPTGYHGLGWKNFGYLKPIPIGSQSGYKSVLSSSSSSTGSTRSFGTLGFVGAGAGIGGLGFAASQGFGGGDDDSGDGGTTTQLTLLEDNIGGDLLTSSDTQEDKEDEEYADCDSEDEECEYLATHAIPEPGTIFLFGSGAAAVALRRRKK